MGLAPTGNKITTMNIDIYRLVNGKLAERWNITDNVGLFQPLGVIEYSEQGARA